MNQDTNKLSPSRMQTRHLKKRRTAVAVIAIIFLIVGVTYALLGGTSSTTTVGNTFFIKEKFNLLVLGVDARDDDVGRSDTNFVVTIDTIEKKITMLSIPRDSRVKIDGHGWDKINHAYAFGGSKLSKSTVEKLLGIPMDYIVVINIQGFVHMIDALGGVTIDIEKAMHYSDPYDDDGGLYIDLHPGVQRLNGKTAIQYVRFRDEEGDIGRVSRQQNFLKALLLEFRDPQIITKLPNLIKEFAVVVKTDMPTTEMVKLIPVINDAAKSGLCTEGVSGIPCWIQEVSYWLPDIKELRYKVAQIQGITIDGAYAQTTDRLASEYANSVLREMKVAESLPTGKRTSNIDKPRIDSDSTKTTITNSSITTISATNKPKSDNISTNGQNSSDSKMTKSTNGQSAEVSGGSTEVIHNTVTTSTNTKP